MIHFNFSNAQIASITPKKTTFKQEEEEKKDTKQEVVATEKSSFKSIEKTEIRSRRPSTEPAKGGATTPDTRGGKIDWSGSKDLDKSLNDVMKYEEGSTTILSYTEAKNNLFDALNQNRDKLHEYIKTQLKATNRAYDKAKVDRAINMALSQITNSTRGNGAGPKTLSDLLNIILNHIDNMMEKQDEKSFASNIHSWEGMDFKSPTKNVYLENTDDYFLSEDEKKVKTVILVSQGRVTRTFHSKDDFSSYLKAYANYLAPMYEQDIVDEVLNNVLNNDSLIKNRNGNYELNQKLITYINEQCIIKKTSS